MAEIVTSPLEHVIRELTEHVSHLEMHRTPEPLTIEDFKRWLKDLEDYNDYHDPSYQQGYVDGRAVGFDRAIEDLKSVESFIAKCLEHTESAREDE